MGRFLSSILDSMSRPGNVPHGGRFACFRETDPARWTALRQDGDAQNGKPEIDMKLVAGVWQEVLQKALRAKNKIP